MGKQRGKTQTEKTMKRKVANRARGTKLRLQSPPQRRRFKKKILPAAAAANDLSSIPPPPPSLHRGQIDSNLDKEMRAIVVANRDGGKKLGLQNRLQRRRSKKKILPAAAAVDDLGSIPPPPPSLHRELIDSSVDKEMRAAVVEVERLLRYSFHKPVLLEEALTHSSYQARPSYERLEYLGDAALGIAFTNYFFLTNPDLGPGPLSILRAANTSTEKLARVAVRHGLYRFIRCKSNSLNRMVEGFTRTVMKEIETCGGFPYGGSILKAPKVLADIVESIAAAVYVDCDLNVKKLWEVLKPLLEPIITSETLDEQPVSTLYDQCQKQGNRPVFKNWKKGDTNITNIFVGDQLVGVGSSEHQMIAKLNAARDALSNLSSSRPSPVPTDMAACSQVIAALEKKEGWKQRLHKLCSKKHWPKPVYKTEKVQGPPHDKRFVCSVQVGTPANTLIALGEPMPKLKDAETAAASRMLSEIQGWRECYLKC